MLSRARLFNGYHFKLSVYKVLSISFCAVEQLKHKEQSDYACSQ